MITFRRAVRFEEIDAARIVFFGRFFAYAHDATEHFFAGLAGGGYAGLVTGREIGLPVVRVESDFRTPLRYGDAVDIDTWCGRLGTRSATLRFRMRRAGGARLVAEISHTVVTTDLRALRSCEMPADVRALLAAHPA